MRLRQILLLIAAAALASSATAAASTLGGTTTSNLGAGSDQVERCDSDGVNISYTIAQKFAGDGVTVISEVTAVTISGINSAANNSCRTGLMRVAVVRPNDTLVGSVQTQTIGVSTSETFTLTPTDVSQVANTRVVIEGGN